MRTSMCFIVLLAALSAAAQAGAPPVEFTFLGLDPASQSYRCQIKILTVKPVAQVDFNLRLFARDGKVLYDRPSSWRNLPASRPQAVEAGQTYVVSAPVPVEGAARAQASLLRVVFADGTGWTPAVLAW